MNTTETLQNAKVACLLYCGRFNDPDAFELRLTRDGRWAKSTRGELAEITAAEALALVSQNGGEEAIAEAEQYVEACGIADPFNRK
jgi:hypothetical protein